MEKMLFVFRFGPKSFLGSFIINETFQLWEKKDQQKFPPTGEKKYRMNGTCEWNRTIKQCQILSNKGGNFLHHEHQWK